MTTENLGEKYQDREVYRRVCRAAGLVGFMVHIKETDMLVQAAADLSGEAYNLALGHRLALEEYLARDPGFAAALVPRGLLPGAPPVAERMARAAEAAGVGPMAAVAGALADLVGEGLLPLSPTVIVENGGDVFIASPVPRTVGVYAGKGEAGFSLGLEVDASSAPVGVCTSSGLIGPSLSFGRARAATVVAESAALADAAATALGNRLKDGGDARGALSAVGSIPGVRGALAMVGGTVGAWGDLKLVELGR